jgi:antitoxin ParD1/3/4
METMNISLPESMKAFVEAEVAAGGYSTASEFVRELIREAQRRKAREALEAKLLEALESGEPVEATPEFWEERRRVLRERLQRQQSEDKP